jgi:hypothetical protein
MARGFIIRSAYCASLALFFGDACGGDANEKSEDNTEAGAGAGSASGGAGRASAAGKAGAAERAGAGSGASAAAGVGGDTQNTNSQSARLGPCPAFPADDIWNRNVEHARVSDAWTTHVRALVGAKRLHPDYGNSGSDHYGIPINVVPTTQASSSITFDYADESDPGPYPFPEPTRIRIEGGTATQCEGDCHVLVVQEGTCKLYEGYACHYDAGHWQCGSGAIWDLTRKSEGQRPIGYTSADAAGLAIAPGLVRYDEAQSGEINHAIRFTLHCSRASYVAPATHQAVPGGCRDNPDAPPMGLRVRLRSDYDLKQFSGAALAVARAMQRYGMILADNGSDFYFQGEQDTRFSEDDVEPLKTIPTDAFEALEP